MSLKEAPHGNNVKKKKKKSCVELLQLLCEFISKQNYSIFNLYPSLR